MNSRQLRLLARLLQVSHGPQRSLRNAAPAAIWKSPVKIATQRPFCSSCHRAQNPVPVSETTEPIVVDSVNTYLHVLPRACPGCGALTHDDPTNKAGFYGRNSIKKIARKVANAPLLDAGQLGDLPVSDAPQQGNEKFLGQDAPEVVGVSLPPEEHGIATDEAEYRYPEGYDSTQKDVAEGARLSDSRDSAISGSADRLSQAVCDRCHDLAKENIGNPILHPTVGSIAAIIDESPFHRNHVYHVLDAADFPASLLPNVFEKLSLVQQRSRNRRAKSTMYKGGHTTTVSFIITRADILLPSQNQVESLMPWFIKTLRSALGSDHERARLGNIHLVSSKRGWHTKEIKEDILRRGGGNWMVGKVNVGKSNLFEVLYPKGSGEAEPDFDQLREQIHADAENMTSALMPPSQPLVPYPTLPLVSSLPGTTASPIRLPFAAGSGRRGELIDLPGLFRSPLEAFVAPEHRTSLVMTKRPKLDKVSLKPAQSLLIGGGLVRITPVTTAASSESSKHTDALSTLDTQPHEQPEVHDYVLLASPFLPHNVSTHLTSTLKAEGIQNQTISSGIPSLLSSDAGQNVRSAGIFTLSNDITKSYAAKVMEGRSRETRKKVEDLPFRIFATDIVIEGVGWVEITCNVRLKGSSLELFRNQRKARLDTDNNKNKNQKSQKPLPQEDNPEASATSSEFTPWPITKAPSRGEADIWASVPRPQIEIFTPGGKGIISRDTMAISNMLATQESRIKKKRKNNNKSF